MEITNRLTEFEDAIAEYLQSTGNLPFADIQMNEDTGEVNIDLYSDFNETVLKQFGGDLDSVLTEYITSLLTNAMENLSDEEIKQMADAYAAETAETAVDSKG
jgi:uncharacterized protein (DUF2252 family)